MKYKKTTLPNGLRIITIPAKGNPSVTVMVASETGSNYEDKQKNGLSHFLEHMLFKGTKTRVTAMDIARELDSLGAESNAFTSNEVTAYHAKGAKKHFKKLVEIIADMYQNPTLPENDLEKERGVILQEISMYEDQPKSKVWEVLIALMYGDQPAGRLVIGTKDNVKKFAREDFVAYRNSHYTAEKTIVVISGDIDEKEVIKEVKKLFHEIPKGKKLGKPLIKESQKSPLLAIHKKSSDQTHMLMAFRTFKATDKRIPALHVLSTVLGQGMSSRLYHRLREEMGACYYVSANTEEFTDHGILVLRTGIDAKRVEEITLALLEECKALREIPVSDEELEKAKEYLLGHLEMHLETSDALAEFYLDQEISSHEIKNPEEIEKEIRKITAQDVMKIAKEVFRDDNLNLAIVGNVRETPSLRKALKF